MNKIFEQSDQSKGHQVNTHGIRSESGATTSGDVNQYAPEATSLPQRVEGPLQFHTVFADANDAILYDDWHRPVERFLIFACRFMTAFVIAGIGALIWANLPI